MSYIIYFIITIGILVFVHEFGHFIAAKLMKMRVDVFSIGFGKRLFGWNRIKGFTFGDLPKDFDGEGNTDYRLCLLPLGGYVKIAGMVDESMDTNFAESEPQPYEFRSKSTPAKLFVITAGVLMNLLLAFLIFAGINYFNPKQVIKSTEIGYVAEGTPAETAGFQAKDKIISINGDEVSNWEEMNTKLFIDNIGNDLNVKVLRNNEVKELNIPNKVFTAGASNNSALLVPADVQTIVDSVLKDSPANKAGIIKGDVLLAMDQKPILGRTAATEILAQNKNNEIPVTILRNNDTLMLSLIPSSEGKLGAIIGDVFKGEVELRQLGLFESMYNGFTDIGKYTALTFSMIGHVIGGNVEFSSAFGGPVKIAQFAAKSADTGFFAFIYFLGMLSLSLAILNILPFPVLDGGHFVIILIEGIMKREIPLKIKVAIQNTGFAILLLFMLFIIYNDIIHL